MSKAEEMTIEGNNFTLVVYTCSELGLHIVREPNIVIACKEVYFNAFICHLGDLTEEAHIATRYDTMVLKPIVEDVAKEINSTRMRADILEPAHESPLYLFGVLVIATAEVGITSEINIFSLCHGLQEPKFEEGFLTHHVLVPFRLKG